MPLAPLGGKNMDNIQIFTRQEQLTQQKHARGRCLLQPVRLLGQDWKPPGRSALATEQRPLRSGLAEGCALGWTAGWGRGARVQQPWAAQGSASAQPLPWGCGVPRGEGLRDPDVGLSAALGRNPRASSATFCVGVSCRVQCFPSYRDGP